MQIGNSNVLLCCCLLCLVLVLVQTLKKNSIDWKIICYTSGNNIADSEATQHVILNGLLGSSQQIYLRWKKGRFRKLGTDIFTASTGDIGPLQNVELWNDGARIYPIWVAFNITFVNLNDGSIYATYENVYINKSRITHSVETIFSPTTTPKLRSSTEINTPQETESHTYFSESFTESATVLDTTSTDMNVPTTDVIYEEYTSLTNDTINIPTDAQINTTTATTTTITTPIIIVSNSTDAATNSTTPAPMCLCPCLKKLSKKEQIEQLKEIKKELTIDKKNTSRYIRKKMSVPDNRPSARATGYVGIVLLIFPFALILFCDLSDLIAYLVAKYKKPKG